MPRTGEVLCIGKAASVQFAVYPILFRLIRVHDWETWPGWVWLDGYELNQGGDAVERRSVWVQITGIRAVGNAPDPRRASKAKARNAARVPRQRTAPATTSAPTSGRTR